jgi:ribonuclease P protein component
MLPKANRLVSDKDFKKIWKRGQSFYTKSFGFKLLPNFLAVSRFGIVVGNKVSPLATERNLLKRRLREIIGIKLKKISPGFDLVVSALPPALLKKYLELEKEISAGLNHFKLIK